MPDSYPSSLKADFNEYVHSRTKGLSMFFNFVLGKTFFREFDRTSDFREEFGAKSDSIFGQWLREELEDDFKILPIRLPWRQHPAKLFVRRSSFEKGLALYEFGQRVGTLEHKLSKCKPKSGRDIFVNHVREQGEQFGFLFSDKLLEDIESRQYFSILILEFGLDRHTRLDFLCDTIRSTLTGDDWNITGDSACLRAEKRFNLSFEEMLKL